MPGAQTFALCTAGNGGDTRVRFKSALSHQKAGVAPGKVLRYQASIKNTDKRVAVQGLALTVQLPAAGVAYLGSKSSHAFAILSTGEAGAGKASYRRAKSLRAFVNTTVTPATVTWSDLALPPRKGMRFSVHVRVANQGVVRGMPLVFRGALYQQLPANGLPYCSSASVNQTVLVK